MKFYNSILACSVLVAFSVQPAFSQESRFQSLLGEIESVTDEALHIPSAATSTLVGQDCDVDDTREAELNAQLSISASERAAAEDEHAKYGLPVATMSNSDEEILHHKEYLINHNGNLKVPTYASYQLDKSDIIARTRMKCFRVDPRLSSDASAIVKDYDEPTYDRGHLVPRADMNRSEEVMLNTFVLSNIMPQHDDFNRGVWRKFESTVRAWAKAKGSVHIVTGAVFDKEAPIGVRDNDDDAKRVWPLKNIGVPTHFYKIVLHERSSGFIEPIAVLLPHTDDEFPMDREAWEELEWIEDHIVSIDEIEAVAGYDFFPDLPDSQERAVERAIASGLWQ